MKIKGNRSRGRKEKLYWRPSMRGVMKQRNTTRLPLTAKGEEIDIISLVLNKLKYSINPNTRKMVITKIAALMLHHNAPIIKATNKAPVRALVSKSFMRN